MRRDSREEDGYMFRIFVRVIVVLGFRLMRISVLLLCTIPQTSWFAPTTHPETPTKPFCPSGKLIHNTLLPSCPNTLLQLILILLYYPLFTLLRTALQLLISYASFGI